jgi:hypothetical protein
MLFWTPVAAISTTLLAIATFVLSLVAYCQLRDSHLGIVVGQRAFVYAKPAGTSFFRDHATGNMFIEQKINLINSGNTQTKALRFFVRCTDSTTRLPEPFVLLFKENPASTSALLGPKASTSTTCDLSADKMAQMQGRKLYGYLMDQLLYKDVIDETDHKTDFCLEYSNVQIDANDRSPTFSSILINVGAHNCADAECPQ